MNNLRWKYYLLMINYWIFVETENYKTFEIQQIAENMFFLISYFHNNCSMGVLYIPSKALDVSKRFQPPTYFSTDAHALSVFWNPHDSNSFNIETYIITNQNLKC